MEPGPPDSKRQRITPSSSSSSWSPPTAHGSSFPRSHNNASNTLPLPRTSNHPPAPYAPYSSSRHTESHSSVSHTPLHPPGPAPPHPEVDRRHHDNEPLAPMQDHYHHPMSPAHGPYQSYPTRDPLTVKREPTEDHRRPSSTGHAVDTPVSAPHHPPTPHHPLPPPPSYADQGRHMSYDNGPSVPPPGNYRAPSYPPTPITQQPPYESQSYPPAPEFYYSSSQPAKKKNTRASQACDQCRQLKAKCDETKPCKTCRDKGLECRYRDPVPKATDKAQADILEGINVMQNSLTALSSHFVRMDERLTKMETSFSRTGSLVQAKLDSPTDEDVRAARHPPYPNGGPVGPYYPHESRDLAMSSSDHIPPLRMMVEDEVEVDPGPPVLPGEPAIPINHTTLAGLLLEWPSIRDLTKRHIDREGIRFIPEYPISKEQNRGSLIVYGRGEDCHYSRQHVQIDHGTLDMADDASDIASPSPAADFGQLGGPSPADMEYRGGVLGFDGNPDFSDHKVRMYVESFQEHILNMHPIVTPKVLKEWVDHFLSQLSPTTHQRSARSHATKTAFAISTNAQTPEAVGSKRKRSPGPDGSDGPSTPGPAKPGKPDRSINSALVLTVLALGKICLFRDYVPDAVPSGAQADHVPQGSPALRNGIPQSPGQGSPPGYSNHSHSAQASPKDQPELGSQSRRPSVHGSTGFRSGYGLTKNHDMIPGLEYFACATDILGNHEGSYNSIRNVYANIFAGLYHGQLGRPLESFAYIHKASHKLQVLMRPSLDKMRGFKREHKFLQDQKYNQLALAFWTCLQLESDLIAELQLPPSGLLSYEDDMPHPNMSLLRGFSQQVLDSYPGQLYLRTHLNSIHRMFYAPDDPSKAGQDKFSNVELVADAVSGMNWVAPGFAFREDDPPADNILAARLRAKYWGAQVITYRPFIRQILQFSHSLNHQSSPNQPISSEFRTGIIAPVIHPNTKSLHDIDSAVVELAKKGIKALVESTRAFHNLGKERPIITNVFGTAHAQWGNLLVLSACYRDPVLNSYVNEDLLRTLFHRTILFLRQSATATSSIRTDMRILEGLQRDLFMMQDPRTNSSFSSHTSVHTPKMATAAAPMHVSHQIIAPHLGPPMPPNSHGGPPHGH